MVAICRTGKLSLACGLALAARVFAVHGEELPGQPKSGQIALVPAAPPAKAEGATPEPPHENESHKWVFSWQGWDGLFLEGRQSTHLRSLAEELGMPRAGSDPLADVHLEQLKLTSRLGARVEVDGAAFTTTGNLTGFDDGVQLRRLRLLAEGDSILLVPFRYKFELGYVPNQFNLEQAYLEFSKIDYVGSLRFGQFQPPMGLQVITSSWDIPLMEPAAPLQAMAPGVEAGVQVGKPFDGERATFHLGVFGPGAGPSEYGNASERLGSLIGRVTGLPICRADSDDPSATKLLHVGLSLGVQYSAASTVRYRSRPESYIAPYVIDTGDIDASGSGTIGAEVSWVNGPFNLQAEFLHSFVGQDGGGLLNFGGFYVLASWFLTGSRPLPLRSGKGRFHARRSHEELRLRQIGMGRLRGGGPLLVHGLERRQRHRRPSRHADERNELVPATSGEVDVRVRPRPPVRRTAGRQREHLSNASRPRFLKE